MGIGDRLVEAIRFFVHTNDRLKRMSGKIDRLVGEVRDLDTRVIRVETAMELASDGAFKVNPRKLAPPTEEQD